MSERREIQMPETQELFEGLEAAEAVRVGDTVYVSGQVGWDKNLEPVAGGLEAQARLAFQHLKGVLEKAGAKPHHITHLQLFFVDTGQGTSFMEKVEVVFKVKKEVLPGCKAAATGVRVAELAHPGLLFEAQAIAVVN